MEVCDGRGGVRWLIYSGRRASVGGQWRRKASQRAARGASYRYLLFSCSFALIRAAAKINEIACLFGDVIMLRPADGLLRTALVTGGVWRAHGVLEKEIT